MNSLSLKPLKKLKLQHISRHNNIKIQQPIPQVNTKKLFHPGKLIGKELFASDENEVLMRLWVTSKRVALGSEGIERPWRHSFVTNELAMRQKQSEEKHQSHLN